LGVICSGSSVGATRAYSEPAGEGQSTRAGVGQYALSRGGSAPSCGDLDGWRRTPSHRVPTEMDRPNPPACALPARRNPPGNNRESSPPTQESQWMFSPSAAARSTSLTTLTTGAELNLCQTAAG